MDKLNLVYHGMGCIKVAHLCEYIQTTELCNFKSVSFMFINKW